MGRRQRPGYFPRRFFDDFRRNGPWRLRALTEVLHGYFSAGHNLSGYQSDNHRSYTQDILYAVTANQLFKSVNGGATWVLKPPSGVRTLAIDPVTPSKLYAGTIVGLSISSNGGDSWTSVTIPVSGGIIGTIEAIAVDPVTPFDSLCRTYPRDI